MRIATAVLAAAFVTVGIASAQTTTAPSSTGNQPMQMTPATPAPLESAKRITREEATKMVEEGKAIFVDVRPKDQYEIGHIKGAINIPLSELMVRYKEIPPHKYIVTYCA